MAKPVRVKFTLDVKPFSINAVHQIGKKRLFYTAKYLRWRQEVKAALQDEDIREKMLYIRKNFDEARQGIFIKLEFGIKEDFFYTKSGAISMRSKDITNIEKPLVDLLFDPKFPQRGDFTNFEIDDRFVVGMLTSKRATKKFKIKVEVEIMQTDKHYKVNLIEKE